MSIYSGTTYGSASAMAAAARNVFEAELAFRDARQSEVPAWIAAAADHLHRAIDAYAAQLTARAPSAA